MIKANKESASASSTTSPHFEYNARRSSDSHFKAAKRSCLVGCFVASPVVCRSVSLPWLLTYRKAIGICRSTI